MATDVLWYQLLAPAVAIALLVRLEAVLLGPYWAWVELLPWWEDPTNKRTRRLALIRRVAIPGAAAFILVTLWTRTYSPIDAALVAATAGGLLLWPALVHGLPREVRASDRELVAIYAALFLSFSASAWLGANISRWIGDEYGSFGSFLRQESLSLVFGTVFVAFGTGIIDRLSTRITARDDED